MPAGFTLASVGTQHLLEGSSAGRQGGTEIEAKEQREKGKHFRGKKHSGGRGGAQAQLHKYLLNQHSR